MRKTLGIGITVLAAAVIWTFAGSSTQAFHSGGVAECGGCHSMHAPKAGGSYLLIGTDPSSTCLTCHMHAGDAGPSSYHIATPQADMPAGTPPKQLTPGGDFGWLRKQYIFTVRGTTTTEEGQTHGHNIVAKDTEFAEDFENTTAPGGTFISTNLGCTSCHDPHGRLRRKSDESYATAAALGTAGDPIIGSGSYASSSTPAAGQAVGAYRLLRGLNDTKDGATFKGVAVAIAPSTYNRTEASTQTRVAYGGSTHDSSYTWGNWCATCHPDMHSSGNYVHPIDESLGTDIAKIYNAYVKSGDLTGVSTGSFNSLVPFAHNSGVAIEGAGGLKTFAVNNDSNLNGPTGSDKVMCLSCHRAHASGWEYSLRWNMEGEFMIYNSLFPGTDTTPTVPQFARGRLGAETQKAYYDRPVTKFASYQRVLCNKCHAKD